METLVYVPSNEPLIKMRPEGLGWVYGSVSRDHSPIHFPGLRCFTGVLASSGFMSDPFILPTDAT